MALEEEFALPIPDDDAAKLLRVSDVVDYVEKYEKEKGKQHNEH